MTNYQKNTLDKLWAELVRLIAQERCEKCQRITSLNSHHFFGRRNMSVRYDERNGFCLCAYCHALSKDSAHQSPAEFVFWAIEKRGQKWYDDLQLSKNLFYKPDYQMIKMYFEQEINKYK